MEKTKIHGTEDKLSVSDIDYCSMGNGKRNNEDYVLITERVGACVADGVGGAPLGDAVARLACHAAMRALERGASASRAVAEAQNEVARFIEAVESPRSGASLAVVATRDDTLDVSWAGDVALFVLRRGGGADEMVSSLDDERFPTVPALGRRNGGGVSNFREPIEALSSMAICTDGAWRSAGPQRIGMLLSAGESARKTAAMIVRERRSRDDSTALVLRV